VVEAAKVCLQAGCGGITVHPRPDQRHIRPDDVRDLASLLRGGEPEFNVEGNPFAPARGGYPGMLALCAEARPAQATLVPDTDGQITSDHGFDIQRDAERLKPLIREFKAIGCRVSLFMDADSPDIERVADLGADRIELYTGPYAHAFAAGDVGRALDDCARAAERALRVGLGVNAGHDLNQANLGLFLRTVPNVAEVSIGHALIGEAIYDGLAPTVRHYLAAIAGAH
jgi:pyridoxine 5-phosphate synthase